MLPGKWGKEKDGKSEKNDIGGEGGEKIALKLISLIK